MKLLTTAFVSIFLIFASCGHVDPNSQIDEGKITGTTYESKEIGWSMELPAGWKIVSKDKIEANDETGKKAIEKSSGLEIDTKTLKHLISFQKDAFNIFASTAEPFKEEYPGQYEQNNAALNEIMYNTFADQGIKVDTASSKETIQGLDFNVYRTTVYAPDGKVIMNQILYSRLINGYDFGVNMNYNNEQDKATMMNAFLKSKFTKN
ncbi:MAG: hypothetical protein JST26_13370 [Bacteroidetes bacterium]|nr:hypothetical protein [Bacteroidota bacterium]